jgi:outer membrane biosynthesis protein TonB
VKLRIHLFEWPSRHNVHLALPVMLILSFLLHVGSLFLFHATIPRSDGSPERDASVNYILPGSPEAAKLAPILAASDPALFSPAQVFGPDVWNLPETTYVASFDEETPALKPLPSPPPTQFLPPVAGTAPVTVATIAPKASSVRQPAPPTTVRFSGALEDRAWTPPAGFQFSHLSASTRQGRAPAEFLVAVSPEGLPLHFFLQQSSGDENLDRAALRYLAGGRFEAAPSNPEPAWGTATFIWGGEISSEKQP